MHTQKNLLNQRLKRISLLNALLILIAPKLVFAAANAFFEPEDVKKFIRFLLPLFAVEGRSKNSLSLFFF